MRLATFVASVAFFAASGSALAAFAADCTKGMLWPYTRNPGDCLTDAEIKAGRIGVYAGPVNTNVDVSSINPDASAVSSGGTVSGGESPGNFAAPPLPAGQGRRRRFAQGLQPKFVEQLLEPIAPSLAVGFGHFEY